MLIFFHGGGLEKGDKAKDCFYTHLQKKGVAVVTANYRLYPEASYPDFIKDAAAAVAWTYNNISNYGTPSGFFIGGS